MLKSLQHWAEARGVWAEPLPQAAGGARQGRQRVVNGPWTGEGQGTASKGVSSRRQTDDRHVEARHRRVTESRVGGGKDGEAGARGKAALLKSTRPGLATHDTAVGPSGDTAR